MGAPIVMPQQKTWGDQIGPLFMSMYLAKFKHNMDMDVLKEETKLETAKLKEKRQYQEKTQLSKEGRAEESQIRKEQRVKPYKEGQLLDIKIGDKLVQHKYTQDKFIPTGITAPRYKPGVTLNLKQSSASERENLATGEASISNLNNLRGLFDEAYVGPFAGRVGKVKDIFGGNPEKQSNFNAATSAFKNQIIKEITGAQMSEPEAKRIMKQVPDVNDPPSVWKAKWNQSKRNVAVLREKRLEIMRKSGIKTPESKEEYDFEWIPGQGLTPVGGE